MALPLNHMSDVAVDGPRLTTATRSAWSLPPKYEEVRVIGTGGMGTVYLARDKNLGRLVAIKTLAADCSAFLDRLRDEARLLARLDHPSILRVHELDVRDGRLYLAMEYAPGGNVALARFAPVPLVRTLRGVVDALAHAHAHGIVHRDVKPENLLLIEHSDRTPNGGRAILSDFGLAYGAGEGTGGSQRPIVGTPLAMSPEQIDGEPLGPPSDVFSLGVTFYQKLSGRWPFRGRTVLDVFDAIQHREPESLRADGVPRKLDSIVRRALAKDPVARFASMDEFGRALDGFVRFRSLFSFARKEGTNAARRRVHPEDKR